MYSKEYRKERAKDDAKMSNDLARVAAQAAILINGGAATAVIAFFSNVGHDVNSVLKSILPIIPISLSIYSFGVFLGAIALATASMSIEQYMCFWMRLNRETKYADRLWRITLVFIVSAGSCFLFSSLYLAWNLRSITVSG